MPRNKIEPQEGESDKYKECPYCFAIEMETIIINFDTKTGMMRCRNCYKRIRLGDYDKLLKFKEIKKGGRL